MDLKTFFIGCVTFLLAGSSLAQTGSWNVVAGRYVISSKWLVFAEGQMRSLSPWNHWNYYEGKMGVGYSVNKQLSFLIGAGRYFTYTSALDDNFKNPIINNETRIWEEMTLKNPDQRIKFEHRYRIEQRYTSNGYRNRFRYRFAAAIPLNKREMEHKTLFAMFYEEIFLTNKQPFFERNRVFGGLGYKYSNMTFQAGYLPQFDYRWSNDQGVRISKHFFFLSFLIEFGSKNSVPSPLLPAEQG